MEDDFNTADAIAAVFEMIRLANSTVGETSTAAYVSRFLAEVEKLCQVLGIITEKKEELLDSEVEALIEKRKQARKDKNFALADQIRQELADQGILLEDTREGVKWKRA
jgi:cysteinyl-tRNA synthetase